MYGFGFPGQGFHCLKIPSAVKQQSGDQVGLIQVKSGDADVFKIEKELKNLIDSKWSWKVKQISESKYLATFPNKMILDTFSRSKSLDLALFSINISISRSSLDPMASTVLQTGWIQFSMSLTPPKTLKLSLLLLS